MGDHINNFFIAMFSAQYIPYLCVGFIYVSLFIALRNILTDKAGDGTFWLVILGVVVNIVYCVSLLPKHYLIITKVFYFCMPYIIIFAIVFYIDFLKNKKGKKGD